MSETTSRVVVAIPWIAFAIVIVGIGGTVFMLAMIMLGVLGLREFFRMAASVRPILLPGYLTVAGMVIAAHYGSSFQILLVFAALFPGAFVFAAVRRSHELITTSIAFTVLGVAWMGIGFSHAVLLRDLPLHGGALLIDVLVATFLSDTAAYGAGRLFGSRKITPRISPNKTLEGLIGGFVGATLGFWFAGLYQDWLPGIDALLMGMCIAVIAPIGDLFASMLKRDLGAKDTGSLWPPRRPDRPPRRRPVHRGRGLLPLGRVRVLRGCGGGAAEQQPVRSGRAGSSSPDCATRALNAALPDDSGVYGHPNRPQRCR